MEEIRGTEALEREILDDARKRAERIVRKAEDEAKALQAQTEQKIKAAIDALTHYYQTKQQTAEK
jgi:vacuolar-type H+-ATPase subunit E/Vma4